MSLPTTQEFTIKNYLNPLNKFLLELRVYTRVGTVYVLFTCKIKQKYVFKIFDFKTFQF